SPTFFTVLYRDTRDPASQDFAKQLLVLIGTLVTAVSSFYFGAKAVSEAQAAPDPPPALVGVTPTTLQVGQDPTQLRLTGRNLNSVGHVHLAYGPTEIIGTGVTSNPAEVRAHFQIPDNVPPDSIGKQWDVVVTDANGRTDRL